MAQNFEKFNSHFLDEVIKLAVYKKDVCEVICQHLDYSLIPVELRAYKSLLKSIKTHYTTTQKLPTIGTLLQNHSGDKEVHEAIDKVNLVKLPDKEQTLKTLEEYLKRVKFQLLFQKVADLYNNGQQEDAITLQAVESAKISNFSILQNTGSVVDIFNGFKNREEKRFIVARDITKRERKIPFGIDLLDAATHGGSNPDLGEIDCFLGRSGTGKTKWLRWRGVSAARRGFKVLHIQAEGTLEECELGYDATWTGVLKKYLKVGELPDDLVEAKIDKAIRDIKKLGGSIEAKAFEQFETASMRDVRDTVIDYFRRHNYYPDLLILDYLELFHPGNGKRYTASTEGEKFKREDSARAFKNICNEFKISGATASQANNIEPSDFNNPGWVMTRYNVAGAKNLIDPFSYFITFNVSTDEYKKNKGRLYIDKMRDYKGNLTLRLCTDFDHDRFYNRPETIKTWPEDFSKDLR
jgi:hypothetical protein